MTTMQRAGAAVAALIIIGTTGWALVEQARASAALSKLETERVGHLNALAIADTMRMEIRAEGDSLVAVWQRRAEQGKVELRGALREKDQTAMAYARLLLWSDSIRTANAGSVATEDTSTGTLMATGRLDTAGIHVAAQVEIPIAHEPSRWLWAIVRDPVRFELALTCQADIAQATIASADTAQRFRIEQVIQAREICAPPPTSRPWLTVRLPKAPVLAVTAVAGAIGGWFIRGLGH